MRARTRYKAIHESGQVINWDANGYEAARAYAGEPGWTVLVITESWERLEPWPALAEVRAERATLRRRREPHRGPCNPWECDPDCPGNEP